MTPEPLLPNEAGPDLLPHDHADHDRSPGSPGHVHPPEAPGAQHGYIPVRDWFSWEIQGAGIAVTSLEGNGRHDLLVLMIDGAPGNNRGVYRVGKALDSEGNVTGGWSAWIEIPDWFAWENQGAGLAVAPLGAGRFDSVVFMVDNPAGKNQGYYRIGKGLDAAGVGLGREAIG